MAKIYRFEQLPVYANNEVLLADNIEISSTSSLYADYQMGMSTPNRVYSSDYIQNEVSISYLPSYRDAIYLGIKNNESVKINFGGIYLGIGYVNNFSLSVTPQGLIKASANLTFYNSPENKLNGESLANINRIFIKNPQENQDYRLAQGTFTKLEQKLVKIPMNLEYSIQSELFPRSKVGFSYPTEILFGKKQINVRLESEYIENMVTLEGENAKFSIKLRDMCDLPLNQKHYREYVKGFFKSADDEPYTCDGKIQSINSSVVSKDWLKSSISIIQFC